MITLQFVRGHGIGSGLIAWFGGGDFSHVDFVADDGWLIGARSDDIGGGRGVQRRPPDYEHWTRRCRITLPATTLQDQSYRAFLESQLGKPYDKRAILGFVVGRDWHEPSAWICSELQAAALMSADLCAPLYLSANRITPNDLTLVLTAIGGTVGQDTAPSPRSPAR